MQPDLARTMAILADTGSRRFLSGPCCRGHRRRNGGTRRHDHGRGPPYVTKPARASRCTERIAVTMSIGPPPPSAGGIALIQTLNMLEPLTCDAKGRHRRPIATVLSRSLRRAFLDRARYLGDPDFVAIPGDVDHERVRGRVAPSRSTNIVVHPATSWRRTFL